MKENLKDRLVDLDIKITELASYLSLSRPTVYKFIDLYDQRKFKSIGELPLAVFKYIDSHPYCGKENVIGFLLDRKKEDQSELNLTESEKNLVLELRKPENDGLGTALLKALGEGAVSGQHLALALIKEINKKEK